MSDIATTTRAPAHLPTPTPDQRATARCFAKLTGAMLERALYQHELSQGSDVHAVVVTAMHAEKAAMRGAQ